MSKIKLEVGMRMKCAIKGNLTIERIDTKLAYPIILNAGGIETFTYHEDGSHFTGFNPTLKLLNIPFTEGLEVECTLYGNGVVSHINNDPIKPIGVKFDIDLVAYYTTDGCISPNANQTLFPKYEI